MVEMDYHNLIKSRALHDISLEEFIQKISSPSYNPETASLAEKLLLELIIDDRPEKNKTP